LIFLKQETDFFIKEADKEKYEIEIIKNNHIGLKSEIFKIEKEVNSIKHNIIKGNKENENIKKNIVKQVYIKFKLLNFYFQLSNIY
jgi:hypothetical protein